MKFITCSPASYSAAAQNTEQFDSDYVSSLNYLTPLLEQLGEVFVVEQLDQAERLYDDLRKQGEASVFLSFTQPHETPLTLACPTIPIFSWGYSSIPNTHDGSGPQEDWNAILHRLGRAITHSSYSLNAIKKLSANALKIESIPAPVWDSFDHIRKETTRPCQKKSTIELGASIVDSDNFQISVNGVTPKTKPAGSGRGRIAWDGSPITCELRAGGSQLFMPGFYNPENWGIWSQSASPWIMLPLMLSGEVEIILQAQGFGRNTHRDITFSLGDKTTTAQLSTESKSIALRYTLKSASNHLRITGLDTTPPDDSQEQRTLGIGISSLLIRRPGARQTSGHSTPEAALRNTLTLSGVVYTSIFNPTDERTDWKALVTAFCRALGNCSDATLLIKANCVDLPTYLEDIFHVFSQLPSFKCRIVVLHGSLHKQELDALIRSTSYIVNTSNCEGQSIPMLEFMSAGKPSISINKTAMADYVTTANTFIIDSDVEPTYWPHNPRQSLNTLWYKLSWESLVEAFRKSYSVARHNPGTYQAMREDAIESLRKFCSITELSPRLERVASDLDDLTRNKPM